MVLYIIQLLHMINFFYLLVILNTHVSNSVLANDYIYAAGSTYTCVDSECALTGDNFARLVSPLHAGRATIVD
jgi:hypothetical protein